MHLESGKVELVNIAYFFADDQLTCEDLFIERFVLQHFQIESKIWLENNCALLGVTNRSNVCDPTMSHRGGQITRILISRLSLIPNSQVIEGSKISFLLRSTVNFLAART